MRLNTETTVGIFILGALGVFFYMTFQIGVFRLDSTNYKQHTVFFMDVSGLSRKADVKIAGVRVGWVDNINLVQGDQEYKAEATIMVDKRYVLRSDSSATVKQDGLLGVKYLELTPGNPLLPALKKGDQLGAPGKVPASIDGLVQKFGKIADNIEDITVAVRDSVAGGENKKRLQETFEDVHSAAKRIASFAESLDRIVTRNENDIEGIIHDVRDFAKQIKESYPELQQDIHRVAQKLEIDTLPAFQASVERIANVFDRDFGKVSGKLESTADAIESAALQTRDGFKSIGAIADKINEGKGLIGKLVNEEETYQDLKVAVAGLKDYFSKVESLGIVFDSHAETMYRPAENFSYRDSKGYFDIRIHPNEDRFYILEMSGSLKGTIKRRDIDVVRYDSTKKVMTDTGVSTDYKWAYPSSYQETIRERDTTKYGFQFGKVFNNAAFRFGIFESTFGIGIDYELPFENENMRWVSSFELFDIRGRDRINDQRPHFKWINRVFFLRNFYFNFGADDFISRDNANTFFGVGVRFGDDDMKYLMSKLGFGSKS